MKTPESPLDLDSLLNTPVEVASDQPTPPIVPVPANVFDSPVAQTPAQVSENRWDQEEILDIPRATSSSGQMAENPLAIEDLLSTAPLPGEVLEPYAEYPHTQTVPAPELDLLRTGTDTFGSAATSYNQAEAADDILEDYVVSEERREVASAALDETPTQETAPFAPPRPSVFAQDSYVRNASNTYVMATPDRNNKGRLAKVFLAAALGFALLGVGYFALSGLVKDWLGLRKQQIATSSPVPSLAPTSIPSVAPSQTTSGANTKNASPTVAASASPSATVAASVKPSATPKASATPAVATPTPGKASNAANQNAAAKPTPTPAPAKTGTSGHSVGASEGSLAVQVASFKSSGEAQQAASKLKSAGVEARVVKADVPGMGVRFRVQAGRFANEAEASKYAGELRTKGVARDFIVTSGIFSTRPNVSC